MLMMHEKGRENIDRMYSEETAFQRTLVEQGKISVNPLDRVLGALVNTSYFVVSFLDFCYIQLTC